MMAGSGDMMNELLATWAQPHTRVLIYVILAMIAGVVMGIIWAPGHRRRAKISSGRYKEIVTRLDSLAELPRRLVEQHAEVLRLLEGQTAPPEAKNCADELRRLFGEVFAITFQIYAVEQASANERIDPRIIWQLKERAMTLVSRALLYIDHENRDAHNFLEMLRHKILGPKLDQYAEWEVATAKLAQDIICGRRAVVDRRVRQSSNFAHLSQSDIGRL